MNQWPFVIAAYALVVWSSLALVLQSLASMRRAERDADALKDRR